MSIATERPDELLEILKSDLQEILGWVIIQDQKQSGTNGGTFTSGAWQTRDLNTTVLNTIGSGYSLAANQFTLPTGNYIILGSAPARQVNRHHAMIQNITDGATVIEGTSAFSLSTANIVTVSLIIGFFSISTSKVFELQHRCEVTDATFGFGVASGGGGFAVGVEVYSELLICKIG